MRFFSQKSGFFFRPYDWRPFSVVSVHLVHFLIHRRFPALSTLRRPRQVGLFRAPAFASDHACCVFSLRRQRLRSPLQSLTHITGYLSFCISYNLTNIEGFATYIIPCTIVTVFVCPIADFVYLYYNFVVRIVARIFKT